MIYNRRVVATIQSNKVIPDHDPGGLRSQFNCRLPGQIVSIKVTPDLSHPFVQDLQLNLISPAGTVVVMQNRTGGAADDVHRTFEGGPLDTLLGQEAAGEWTLQVIDHAARDQGMLHNWKIEIALRRVVAALAEYKKKVNQIIPDNDANGVMSRITVQPPAAGAVLKASNLRLHLHVEHSHIGDLIIKLTAPSGRELLLHNRSGWSTQNIERTLAGTELGELREENLAGDWDLRVVDTAARDVGRLVSWGLAFVPDGDLAANGVLDPAATELLSQAGVHTRSALAAAVPLEVSSILAMRRHTDPIGIANRVAAGGDHH